MTGQFDKLIAVHPGRSGKETKEDGRKWYTQFTADWNDDDGHIHEAEKCELL